MIRFLQANISALAKSLYEVWSWLEDKYWFSSLGRYFRDLPEYKKIVGRYGVGFCFGILAMVLGVGP
jgi:hypothetical protein